MIKFYGISSEDGFLVFKNVKVHRSAFICRNSRVKENVKLGKGTEIYNSSIGKHTYIVNARVSNAEIGAFSSIGSGVKIGGLGIHPLYSISTSPVFYSLRKQTGATFQKKDLNFEEIKKVTIGNDVWIGVNAIVLDGVKVGDGVVIAAGAVITEDIPQYAIVGGVPAKLIKYRHEENLRDLLIKSEWWTWQDDRLELIAQRFNSENPLTYEEFFNFLNYINFVR